MLSMGIVPQAMSACTPIREKEGLSVRIINGDFANWARCVHENMFVVSHASSTLPDSVR